MKSFAARLRGACQLMRLLIAALLFACLPGRALSAWHVEVALGPSVVEADLTGRLFVFFSKATEGPPYSGPNWFSPDPFFGRDVAHVRSGDVLVIDDRADGFPGPLSELPFGQYRVQALLDIDQDHANHAEGVGNYYSEVVEFPWPNDGPPPDAGVLRLTLGERISPREFPQQPWLHEIALPSPMLSEFLRREVLHRATVVLPAGYESQPERRYPVVYIIPGFGGDHYPNPNQVAAPPAPLEGEADFIRVLLSGQCKWGHHVYADSATNGPRGTSLIEELIPHIDANFRTVAAPAGRFVTGHSSGGWSSLWLQVRYPETFGGVWSTAPDPVDFRDYQQVDLYADPPLSLYDDEQGQERPIARRGDTPVLWYRSFGRMDDVLCRGGQLRSFEAVFSPLGPDGQPRQLWDRQTGRIDPQVARAWANYDIRLVIERDWERLRPLLAGKLHIWAAEYDTFYLEGAVRRLAETLQSLGSDAQVTIVPGADHGSLLSPDLLHTIRLQMTEHFQAGQTATPAASQ